MNTVTTTFIREAEHMVRSFMRSFDQKTYPSVEHTPCEISLLRSRLITEEAKEYHSAEQCGVEELDGLCDLLYVVLGTNIAMSVPIEPPRIRLNFLPSSYKVSFWKDVLAVTQDLDCRFPCADIQRKGLSNLTNIIFEIASGRSYKFEDAFRAVHESNMSKLWEERPGDPSYICKPIGDASKQKLLWCVKRSDGKVVKPPTFKPPELTPFI